MRPRIAAIFRTTAARLSALFLLLFTVSALGLVFYVTSLSERMLVTQTRETIDEEALSLASIYERAGLPGLVRSITLRARRPGANL